MKFLWPGAFFLLALIPLVGLFYLWVRRRRQRNAVRYSSLSLLKAAIPAQSRLRRYVPPALFFIALTSLTVGLARPVAVTQVPAERATIMLVLDVSLSMRQTDIQPSRLGAAKLAALSFISRQKANNQIGVVAFAGIAQLSQPPTTDTESLEKAINQLNLGRGTAIGSGILTGLKAIGEVNKDVAARINTAGLAAQAPQSTQAPQGPIPVTGGYEPDIIVLLTDGVNTTGPDPLEATQWAVASKVRVYTIGYGTQMGGNPQDNTFGFGGRGFRQGIDEATLQQIADLTGGKYFSAASADQLQKVFDSLPSVLITRQETTEISVVFAALAALFVIGAVILAQLWRPLP